MLLPPASNTSLILNLAKDLRDLAGGDGDLATLAGVASVVFGGASPSSASESVDPTPTVDHSSVQQDRAVHSAMTNPLTVVTGPPGSGKSQVVLNTVAAAVCRGETVLIASKNNKAVDVVVERLRTTVPHCPVVRAGAASQRQALASAIDRLVGEAERAEPAQGLVDANDEWRRTRQRVRAVHEMREKRHVVLQEMQSLEARLARSPLPDGVPEGLTADAVANAVDKVKEALGLLDAPRQLQTLRELDEQARRHEPPPDGLPESIDPADVTVAAEDLEAALRTLARPPGLFGRQRRRQARLAAVHSALERFGELLPHLRESASSSVAQVDDDHSVLGVGEARERFGQVAAEALDAAKAANAWRSLARASADFEERMAGVRDALAAFGDCVPHLRERAESCLAPVEPLAAESRVRECRAMLEAVFDESRRDESRRGGVLEPAVLRGQDDHVRHGTAAAGHVGPGVGRGFRGALRARHRQQKLAEPSGSRSGGGPGGRGSRNLPAAKPVRRRGDAFRRPGENDPVGAAPGGARRRT